MNFTVFPASATNIFPIANSHTGGQLLTEFNLRSRESVLTPQEIKYSVGPSYTHSQDDFKIQALQDEAGTTISSTVLEITSGRALVNGHYVECLTNVSIDMTDANILLQSEGLSPLTGELCVGLRAMYSTEQTLSSSLRIENNQNIMEGIQVVILPPNKFILPQDSPNQEELVTAHLKLGKFYYINGSIRSVTQNENKIQAIPASRVGDFDSLLTNEYVTRKGLNPKKLYTFAGKSIDPETGKDTWCDSTDSLFIWQKAANLTLTENPQLEQAEFGVDENDSVTLTIPHKLVDGGMFNTSGNQVYYNPRIMTLPKADFMHNTAGTVSSSYTRQIKNIQEEINKFYTLPNGHQRGFVESLSADRRELPTINQGSWRSGDYVIVGTDNSVISTDSTFMQAPATMYIVRPPIVSGISLVAGQLDSYSSLNFDDSIPASLTGSEIAKVVYSYSSAHEDTDSQADVLNNIKSRLGFDEDGNPPASFNDIFGIEENGYRGTSESYSSDSVIAYGEDDAGIASDILISGQEYTQRDYFTVEISDTPYIVSGSSRSYKTCRIYFSVSSTQGKKVYSDPVVLTGTIQLATEDTIGGFYNVPDTQLDAGYVYRDESGYLRLLDYSLLRTGVLAYQLGQDYDFGVGLTSEELQEELNNYVNDRVAFPTAAQIASAKYPNMLELTLNLSEEDSAVITLQNIDSRYGTGIYLHITGNATDSTTLNIVNVEKIRIDAIEGDPVINLYNCGLYYDDQIIDYIRTCNRVFESTISDPNYYGTVYSDGFSGIENLKIWYQRFSENDPDLVVDGMTITEVNTPIIPDDFDFWSESVVNDNHFYYGLQSLTLSPEGDVIGCGIYMRNDMSANIVFGKSIYAAKFVLPQGSSFAYPVSSISRPIKITGNFVTAYPSSSSSGYVTMETSFTALSQVYNPYQGTSTEFGTISFLVDAELINSFIGLEDGVTIDGWESNGYHVFKGWTIA